MTPPTQRQSLAFLVAGVIFFAVASLLVFGGVFPVAHEREFDQSAYGPALPVYQPADFRDLTGWDSDAAGAAIAPFLKSCDKLMRRDADAPANSQENLGPDYSGFSLAGPAGDWAAPCAAARELDPDTYSDETAWNSAARLFFETHFRAVKIMAVSAPRKDGPARGRRPQISEEGVFTGYFEPIYEARLTPEGPYTAPLYTRPEDLIDVDLGAFKQDLAGARIAGRIEGNRLVPYADRKQINAGAVGDNAKVLAYLDPNDLFFLQIQGSGQLRMADGSTLRVGYAGANGQAYTAIGRLLVERGAMPLSEASMQTIRAWLNTASPEDARALREANASYVFFHELPAPPEGFGPPGAQGAPLSPGRSLAVDRRYHALGAPVFVDIEPVAGADAKPIRRLMVAQDTGGAIKGPVRGDFFWGAGAEAGDRAGVMNAKGRMFVLLPVARAEALQMHLAGQ